MRMEKTSTHDFLINFAMQAEQLFGLDIEFNEVEVKAPPPPMVAVKGKDGRTYLQQGCRDGPADRTGWLVWPTGLATLSLRSEEKRLDFHNILPYGSKWRTILLHVCNKKL